MLIHIPTADNYLLQGVTSLITGNCGSSSFPLNEFFRKIKKTGTAVNIGSLVGHNTIRALYMGSKTGRPTDRELQRMKEALDREMRSGAFGLSTGLIYRPGMYADQEELIALARVIAEYDGLYASHIRSEGRGIDSAIREAVRVGSETGVKIQISHLKLAGEHVWGQTDLITDTIRRAMQENVRITTDQYPYTASSAPYSALFPGWARQALFRPGKNPEAYRRMRLSLERMFLDGMDSFLIAAFPPAPEYEGKSLPEILEMQGKKVTSRNAVDLLLDIQKSGGATGIFFLMDHRDVEELLKLEYNMIASDGKVLPGDRGVPHPRNYGTFPRLLGRYVYEKNVLRPEEAVHKMTLLPARTLGINDRGRIAPGMKADLVIYDPEKIRDTATYKNPHQYPKGIIRVLVNGRTSALEGASTGVLSGRILYGPGEKKEDSV
jgi:N-acyl-D-amino-acid deacylase